jgi:hypothetical protein
VTNTGFEVIGYFSPNLRRLKLKECGQIRDDAIQVLASQLAQLEEVTLSGCFLVTDTAMAHAINSWSHLKSLRIEHCPKLGPLCAEAISSIPTLQQLSLVSCDGLQDDHLNVIASKASSLNSFELIRCPMVRSTETLRRFLFSNLQSLTLSYLQIPEEDWSLLMQQVGHSWINAMFRLDVLATFFPVAGPIKYLWKSWDGHVYYHSAVSKSPIPRYFTDGGKGRQLPIHYSA